MRLRGFSQIKGKAAWFIALALVLLGAGGCATVDDGLSGKMLGVTVDTGMLPDGEAQWRGMVLGGPFQPPIRENIPAISRRAAGETIQKKMPVIYLTTDGSLRLESLFLRKEEEGGCSVIRERIYRDGHLAREEFKRVCP